MEGCHGRLIGKRQKLGKQDVNQITTWAAIRQLAITVFEPLHMHTKPTHSFVRGLGHLKAVVALNSEMLYLLCKATLTNSIQTWYNVVR